MGSSPAEAAEAALSALRLGAGRDSWPPGRPGPGRGSRPPWVPMPGPGRASWLLPGGTGVGANIELKTESRVCKLAAMENRGFVDSNGAIKRSNYCWAEPHACQFVT